MPDTTPQGNQDTGKVKTPRKKLQKKQAEPQSNNSGTSDTTREGLLTGKNKSQKYGTGSGAS